MKTRNFLPLWTVGLLFLFPHFLYPQPETPLFDGWEESDKAAIEALVMYPQNTRADILEAAQYPELLIKIEGLQHETSQQFQDLIASLGQDQQEMIYDLSRYPALVSRLVMAKEAGARSIEDILKDYPDVIHTRAKQAYREYGNLLIAADQLHLSADHQFNVLIATYPSDAREAYHNLIELPEVLSLLTENIRMTILVGDLYQKDPDRLHRQMDSLNLVVAEANAKELETWKESIEDDPEVMAELRSASNEFAEEYGYDDEYYAYDDMYNETHDRSDKYVVEQYFHYNYPYWFGFPSWYYYPRWRPYPIWYETGFYAVMDVGFVVHRLPSFYFTHWYFYRPYHHYYYPHLSRRFVRHTYYGPRPGTSSIAVSVRSWQHRNQDVITETWLQDDRNSINRFREYGKFELDRSRYNLKKTGKELSPAEYLERHPNRYPALKRTNVTRSGKAQSKRSTTRPKADIMDRKPTAPRQIDQPTIKRERIPIKPRVRTEVPKRTVPKVQKGVDQHRRTIERSRTTQPRVTPRAAPKVRPKAIPRARPKAVPKSRKTRTKKAGGGF